MKYPINFDGQYPNKWAGYYFKEPLGYTTGVHTGVDWNRGTWGDAEKGEPVYAIADGEVRLLGDHTNIGFGNTIIIETIGCPSGISGDHLYHRYMHLLAFNVSINQKVKAGDLIGWIGDTGTVDAHLHLDTWTDRNGLGVHLEYHKDTQLNSYEDPYRLIEAFPDWNGQPQGLQPYQRIVSNDDGVNGRTAPNTSSAIVQEFPAGEVLDFAGYVEGEDPYGRGNNIWFKGKYAGNYFYSGAFSDKTTNGLPNLTQPAPQPPTEPPYTFVKDLPCVTEVIPVPRTNFQVGNFPVNPRKVVLHDFGTDGKDTIESTINEFTRNSEKSAHFVVSGKRIVQMVSLKDRAWHAGPNGNDFVGIESDPIQDADTIASVRQVLIELKAYYGYELVKIKHSDIMQTLCGDDIDFDNYNIDPLVPPQPPDEPDPVDPPTKPSLIAVIVAFIKMVLSWFRRK